jgi:putative hydrolase of the HAD superfamily
MRTRFVYFDLGNVLLGFSHEQAARQMAELAGCSYALAWEVVFGTGRLELAYEVGELSSPQFHDLFCQQTNTQPPYEEFLLAGAAIFTPFQQSWDIVSELKSRGHRLGILSNTCDAHWQYCAANYSLLLREFVVECLSFRVGCMKPQAMIYENAIAKAECDAEEIFFVDDRPENVAGARKLGIDAVLFVSPEQLRADLQQRELL